MLSKLQRCTSSPRQRSRCTERLCEIKSKIGHRKSIDSLASRSLTLSGLPVHFAASPAAQLTHFPPSEVRIGSSSIMNCVLPIAPIMCVPVALYHFFDMLSPVWQPQLLT